jgi:hypothetical protein
LPSALMTRAMAWVGVKDEGGVDVSSAAANTLRFGRPMLKLLLADRVLIELVGCSGKFWEMSAWKCWRASRICAFQRQWGEKKYIRSGTTFSRRGPWRIPTVARSWLAGIPSP